MVNLTTPTTKYLLRLVNWSCQPNRHDRLKYNMIKQQQKYVYVPSFQVLARYASICQSEGLVPIVEPDVILDGN